MLPRALFFRRKFLLFSTNTVTGPRNLEAKAAPKPFRNLTNRGELSVLCLTLAASEGELVVSSRAFSKKSPAAFAQK